MMTIMTLTMEMALDMPVEMLVKFFESVFLESVSFKCICAQLLVGEELIGTKLV